MHAFGKPLYTCLMHPEVRQHHPGDFPKCGMTLELQTAVVGPVHAEPQESAARKLQEEGQDGDVHRD